MVSFKSVILTLTAATAAVGSPFDLLAQRDDGNPTAALAGRLNTPNGEGTHNGYFYSWWTNGRGSANFTMGEGGKYSVAWEFSGEFVGGKGWNPGTGRAINYSGSYNPRGNSYLAVYGWTRDPLVEYFVVETYGTLSPSVAARRQGTLQTDGSTYDVALATIYNQSSIDGIRTFQQFWSVRRQKRVGGNITMQNHFDAWRSFGMELGTHHYQIVATEGYLSSGNSEIEVHTL